MKSIFSVFLFLTIIFIGIKKDVTSQKVRFSPSKELVALNNMQKTFEQLNIAQNDRLKVQEILLTTNEKNILRNEKEIHKVKKLCQSKRMVTDTTRIFTQSISARDTLVVKKKIGWFKRVTNKLLK